jgi:hypothetical protein
MRWFTTWRLSDLQQDIACLKRVWMLISQRGGRRLPRHNRRWSKIARELSISETQLLFNLGIALEERWDITRDMADRDRSIDYIQGSLTSYRLTSA